MQQPDIDKDETTGKMRPSGIEPDSNAWEASMLTTTPWLLEILSGVVIQLQELINAKMKACDPCQARCE